MGKGSLIFSLGASRLFVCAPKNFLLKQHLFRICFLDCSFLYSQEVTGVLFPVIVLAMEHADYMLTELSIFIMFSIRLVSVFLFLSRV